MKSIMAVLAVAALTAGCANGSYHRTTIEPSGKTTHVVKQTGYWFTTGNPKGLTVEKEDQLELQDK